MGLSFDRVLELWSQAGGATPKAFVVAPFADSSTADYRRHRGTMQLNLEKFGSMKSTLF